MDYVERVEHNGKLLALIIREKFNKEGLTFLTENHCSLQLGIHIQNKGYGSKPHKHLPLKNIENLDREEMFYVVKGKIVVGLYTDDGKKVTDVEGNQGDIIIVYGGHSLTCSEDTKFIEVKQGPYTGDKDKGYF